MSRTVLVVDDEPAIRTSLELLFTSEGYEVLTAANGREALAMMDGGPATPDIVLLDLLMPIMNGWQVLDAMRGNPALAEIPVVIVSAVTSNRFSSGVTWVKKPVDIDLLIEIVEQQIERSRVRRSA